MVGRINVEFTTEYSDQISDNDVHQFARGCDVQVRLRLFTFRMM